jgi:hypothetical protein
MRLPAWTAERQSDADLPEGIGHEYLRFNFRPHHHCGHWWGYCRARGESRKMEDKGGAFAKIKASYYAEPLRAVWYFRAHRSSFLING